MEAFELVLLESSAKLAGEGGVFSWSLLIIETVPVEVTLSPGVIALPSHRLEP